MLCPNCSNYMVYQGIDDGGGNYGEAIVETFYCPDCDIHEEKVFGELEDYETEYFTYEDEADYVWEMVDPLAEPPATQPPDVDGIPF